MKFRFFVLLLTACTVTFLSCTTYRTNPSGKVPPGQAKKITGSKSAKPFAPGQQKKY